MAIDAVDYSKELSRMRRDFDHATKEKDKISTQEKSRIEDVSQNLHKRQVENFNKHKLDLEKDFDNRLQIAKVKTQEAVDDVRKDYATKLSGIRDDFESRRQEQQKDFDKKLIDVSSSFKSAQEIQQEDKDLSVKNMRENYTRYGNDLKNTQQQELDNMRMRFKETDEASEEKRREETDSMVKDQQTQIQEILSDESKRRLDMIKGKNEQIDSLEKIIENDRSSGDGKQDKLLNDYKKKNDKLVQAMQNNFQEVVATQKEKNEQYLDHEREVNQKKKINLNRMDELEKITLKKRVQEVKDAQLSNADVQVKMSENEKKAMHKRVDLYQNKIDELGKDYYVKNETAREGYMEDLKKTRKDIETKNQKERNSSRENYLENLSNAKTERNNVVRFHTDRADQMKNQFEVQQATELKRNQRKREQNIDSFNEKLGRLTEKNNENLTRIKAELEEKQRDAIIKNQREQSSIMDQMRRDFAAKLDDKESAYSKRINEKEGHFTNLQERFENQVSVLKQNSLKNDRYKDVLFQAKYDGQIEAMKDVVHQQEKDFSKRIDGLKEGYDKKIETLHKDYAKKIKSIISDFQTTINQMQLEKMQENKKIERMSQSELKRLKGEQTSELERLQARFDNRIEQVKNSYEAKIEKLQDAIKDAGNERKMSTGQDRWKSPEAD